MSQTRRARGDTPPAGFLARHLADLRTATEADGGRGVVLDLACGRGRNTLAVAAAGVATVGMDRNASFLRELADRGRGAQLPLAVARTDLESGRGVPARSASLAAVLVFRFLYRPLVPEILRVLRPGGLLLYETFTTGQLALGTGPRNPAFLLEPGELPSLFAGLEILHADEGPVEEAGKPFVTARLLARRTHP